MSGTICYWRGSAELREDILQALIESGYEIEACRSLEELIDSAAKRSPVAIIVDGSAGQREASDRIVELGSTEIFQRYAVVFISSQASKRIAVLKARYPRLFPIDLPYHLHQVMRGIQLLIQGGSLDSELPSESTSAGARKQSSSSPSESGIGPVPHVDLNDSPVGSTSPASLAGEIVDDELSKGAKAQSRSERGPDGGTFRPRLQEDPQVERTRERLRANVDPTQLINTYGGEVLAFADRAEDFDDQVLIPNIGNPAVMLDTLNWMTESNPAGSVHARRVAFVSSAIASSLAFPKEREESVRLAGMFLNFSFHEAGEDHMQYDLLRDMNEDLMAKLSESFVRSSTLVADQLGNYRVSQVIRLAGQWLQKEKFTVTENTELLEEAQCVLMVELSDRSCWSLGFWNPYGAYRTMRHCRGDRALVEDTRLVSSLGRVLSEAVTSHITVGNLFMPKSRGRAEQARIAEAAKPGIPSASTRPYRSTTPLSKNNRSLTVQISELLPGMRLAQPVRALDGRIILDADVKLDHDLLFQLWQLAAVRALTSRVAIRVEV